MKQILWYIAAAFLLAGCVGPDRSDSLVVIDAGHGGHDCGALCGGKQEKELVLQITKKLQKEFKRQGYRVYLTRGSDRFLTLGERTRIADKKDAKVFISIHANAVANKARYDVAEGVETYFLQKTRDEKSQRIAARENAAVLQGTDQLSRNVIIDSVLNGPKIIQSHKLAIDVQNNIMKNLNGKYHGVKNGGVRPAPFYVLVGASRPSILVEVGYITNAKERKRLFTSAYQERIAKGIVAGVSRYLDNRKREMGF
jgi:N-acetylmuramoyl-L-alanine amidase